MGTAAAADRRRSAVDPAVAAIQYAGASPAACELCGILGDEAIRRRGLTAVLTQNSKL